MLVANAFDLWQKDAFFSAAEEVQESADILESAYRVWLRKQGEEGISPEELDGLDKELQAALSTAKWQLEEFERAVRLSYGNCRDENRIARHQQFVVATESQISQVEAALRDSMNEGKVPFLWMNLDEAEREDLALFISGEPAKDEYVKPLLVSSQSQRESMPVPPMKGDWDCRIGLSNDIRINTDHHPDCLMDLSAKKEPRTNDDIDGHQGRVTNIRRIWTAPNFTSLKVIVPEADDEQAAPLTSRDEDSSKEKGSRIFSRGQSWSNQLWRCFYGLQRPRLLQVNRCVQVMSVFMITLFLFVPFFVHSA
ncbi:hypothetical protein Dimus_025731 [Dionaea muscipula]